MTRRQKRIRTIVVLGTREGRVQDKNRMLEEQQRVLTELKASRKERRDAVIIADGFDVTLMTFEEY